jgi:hypothetical protein
MECRLTIQQQNISVLKLSFDDVPHLKRIRFECIFLDIPQELSIAIDDFSGLERKDIGFSLNDTHPTTIFIHDHITIKKLGALIHRGILDIDADITLVLQHKIHTSLFNQRFQIGLVMIIDPNGITKDIRHFSRDGNLIDVEKAKWESVRSAESAAAAEVAEPFTLGARVANSGPASASSIP